MPAPTLRLRSGADRRARSGHPWVYSNELEPPEAARGLSPGAPVQLEDARGRPLGLWAHHPNTLIAARRLDPSPAARIDLAWASERIGRALRLRRRLYPDGHARLVHAEADGLPGLVIDTYGDVVVVQPNSAFADLHRSLWIDALRGLLAPRVLVWRADSGARVMEGLPQEVEVVVGALDGPVPVLENGARFRADVRDGQKTGWFFDQRENRAAVAALAAGGRVLDLYCYGGGFGVLCAARGAREVRCVDRSADALARVQEAAAENGVAERVVAERAEVFGLLEAERAVFDVVIADPPAFAKSRKDLEAAARGYRKLARLSAARVAPGGLLLAGSCSHAVDPARFYEEVTRGVLEAGRTGRVLRQAGAGPDHPLHPQLPESAYLKALMLELD